MFNLLFGLAIRTVQQPREAAEELLQLNISRAVLWSALALAVVLNTLGYQFSIISSPQQVELPIIFSSPLIFAILIGAGLVLSIYSITFAGRFIGGKAVLDQIMVLLVWLQFLRFALQVAAFLLTALVPVLASILVLCATFYGMWILLQFINVAHEFNSLVSSFGVLLLSGLGIMVGLAILLSLLGVQNIGLTPYV